MLSEFDAAYIDELADRLKKRLANERTDEPPNPKKLTGSIVRRIEALFPKIDLENGCELWGETQNASYNKIIDNGWGCLLDTCEFVAAWKPPASDEMRPPLNWATISRRPEA